MKPFVKVCESKVLRRGIVVCCGPKPAIRKLFLDPRTFDGFNMSKYSIWRQWRSVERTWDEELGAFLVEWLFEEICWRGGEKKGKTANKKGE